MKYPLTFYSDKYVSEGAAGTTRGPVIFIRPAYRDDEGLYQHELTHVKQWFAWTSIFALFFAPIFPELSPLAMAIGPVVYKFADEYRLWAEVQAYKKQLKYYDNDRSWRFAGFIADHYGLDVTQHEAAELLRS